MSREAAKKAKYTRFRDPSIKAMRQWCGANRNFYARFRTWLRAGGYGSSAVSQYCVAVRLALGFLDKLYWKIDPDRDLDQVRAYLKETYPSEGTRRSYEKGLAKLDEYLRFVCGTPKPPKPINWAYYVGALADWLADDVRTYITHMGRRWPVEDWSLQATRLTGRLTQFLRWAAANRTLNEIADLTPQLWLEYLDTRLEAGISPTTLNGQLFNLQSFLRFLADLGRPICERVLRVDKLNRVTRLPRDAPPEHLRLVLREIEADAVRDHAGVRRTGIMDRAWFYLMLHSGLRAGEVRRLRLENLDLDRKRIRIEQSKGLKDRIVYLSDAAVDALEAFLPLRGPMETDHVFTYRHKPLTVTYFAQRMRTFAKRCGVYVTPHQLRHSCATLLLNAGAPVLTIQALLGHKRVNTTMEYARLYDGTIAADYYQAMREVERRLSGAESEVEFTVDPGELLALADTLSRGTLNADQKKTVRALRDGIRAWADGRR